MQIFTTFIPKTGEESRAKNREIKWINYFRVGSMKQKLNSIDEHLRTQLRVIIWKQWKVPSKREWGLLKLGVEDWIAHKTAYRGDRYMNVATKSVLTRAISKERGCHIW